MFDEMPMRRNVVGWTALMNGYGIEGNLAEMIGMFRKMLLSAEEAEPNEATMVCLLSACSSVSNYEVGRWVSIFIDINQIPLNSILCTALVDMYSKCGDLERAQNFFHGSSCVSLATWNAIITGHVRQGFFEEAIRLFYCMQEKLVKPNEITTVNVLSACAGLGALELGKKVHLSLSWSGLELNVMLATSLVDMYSRCGELDAACLVFVKTREKDVALWNSMIMGLAYHGKGKDSLAIFSQMERIRERPDNVTFLGILSACNHSGLVKDGKIQFSSMIERYGLSPEIEHYSCMVDLLGRAGLLEEAYELLQNMIVKPDAIIWGTLLSACRIHHNIEIVDKVGGIIATSHNSNMGLCVLLSNAYASAGMWKDVARIRRLVKEKRTKKLPGCSWIEVGGVVHKFVVQDTMHANYREAREIYEILVCQLKSEGRVPNLEVVVKDTIGGL